MINSSKKTPSLKKKFTKENTSKESTMVLVKQKRVPLNSLATSVLAWNKVKVSTSIFKLENPTKEIIIKTFSMVTESISYHLKKSTMAISSPVLKMDTVPGGKTTPTQHPKSTRETGKTTWWTAQVISLMALQNNFTKVNL